MLVNVNLERIDTTASGALLFNIVESDHIGIAPSLWIFIESNKELHSFSFSKTYKERNYDITCKGAQFSFPLCHGYAKYSVLTLEVSKPWRGSLTFKNF